MFSVEEYLFVSHYCLLFWFSATKHLGHPIRDASAVTAITFKCHPGQINPNTAADADIVHGCEYLTTNSSSVASGATPLNPCVHWQNNKPKHCCKCRYSTWFEYLGLQTLHLWPWVQNLFNLCVHWQNMCAQRQSPHLQTQTTNPLSWEPPRAQQWWWSSHQCGIGKMCVQIGDNAPTSIQVSITLWKITLKYKGETLFHHSKACSLQPTWQVNVPLGPTWGWMTIIIWEDTLKLMLFEESDEEPELGIRRQCEWLSKLHGGENFS
jgi:hypothetical protein